MGEKNAMSKEDALELYRIFSQSRAISLSTYHNHIQHYRTLIAAFLSVSIAAIALVLKLEFKDQRLMAVLVFLTVTFPLINILLCKTAIEQCGRPYQMFLEIITIQAKLGPIIGLVGPRPEAAAEDLATPFSQDKNIIPERWLEPGQFSTAKGFVEEYKKRGDYKLTRQLFIVLGIIDFILAAVIVGISFYIYYSSVQPSHS